MQAVRSHLAISLCMGVIFGLWFPASIIAQKASRNQEQAERRWEQAIAAKGGRERLLRINSLIVSYQETVRNFLGLVVHRGPVERLYVFPGRLWAWEDGLPPPFRLSVRTLDVEKDLACSTHVGFKPPLCRKARQMGVSKEIEEAQYLYLMETKWIKPAPIGLRKDNIGFKTVDVVRTKFGDKEIDYYLDRATHLPRRIAVYHNNSKRPGLMFDFSEYVDVEGLKMPGKQRNGKIDFVINPDYDETIFTRTPSIEAGPKAWQKINRQKESGVPGLRELP